MAHELYLTARGEYRLDGIPHKIIDTQDWGILDELYRLTHGDSYSKEQHREALDDFYTWYFEKGYTFPYIPTREDLKEYANSLEPKYDENNKKIEYEPIFMRIIRGFWCFINREIGRYFMNYKGRSVSTHIKFNV